MFLPPVEYPPSFVPHWKNFQFASHSMNARDALMMPITIERISPTTNQTHCGRDFSSIERCPTHFALCLNWLEQQHQNYYFQLEFLIKICCGGLFTCSVSQSSILSTLNNCNKKLCRFFFSQLHTVSSNFDTSIGELNFG